MQKADKILIDYCKIYSAWLDSMHMQGFNLPSVKQRDEWHKATKALYDYTGIEYPKWLAPEFKALNKKSTSS
tara:strand:+ start:798 stop:1013 length:216 start_codon:yes stop_codon:yes gene_type:complete